VRSYDLAWALEELRRREPAVIWLAAAGLFALAAAIFVDRHFIGEPVPLFWDLPVYDAAVRALAEGADPYNSAELHRFGPPDYLHFTSPPAIAWLLTLIAKSGLGPLLKPALLVLHLAAMVGITLVLGRLFFGREPERLALAMAIYRLIALVPAPILFPLVVALVLLGTDLAMRLKVWKLRN
jgi:hypothetical protein